MTARVLVSDSPRGAPALPRRRQLTGVRVVVHGGSVPVGLQTRVTQTNLPDNTARRCLPCKKDRVTFSASPSDNAMRGA
jgi:hypothetical protein